MKTMFLTLLLLTLSFPAMAREETIQVPGIGRVPYEEIQRHESLDGETLDAFMYRIGPLMRAWSAETHFEACGTIARHEDGRFSVIVGTNKSRIACVVRHAVVMEGGRSTGESIHTHGTERMFNANRSDIALMGAHLPPRAGRPSVNGQNPNAFSTHDFEGGPGYLAGDNGLLLHQNGHANTIRHITNDTLLAQR